MNEQGLSAWRELMEWGTKYLAQSRFTEAEEYFSRSVELAQELGIAVILAFSLRLLSTVKVRLGRYEQAKEGFEKALEICEKINNPKGISEAKAGLASVCLATGKLTEAAECYESAIRVYPSTSPRLRLAMMYADLGQVYVASEEWDKAKNAYRHAISLCQLENYLKGEGEIYILLGEICFRQGKIDDAKRWIEKSCQLFAMIKEEGSLATSSQYIAFICFELEDYLTAIQYLQRAIALWLRRREVTEASEGCYFLSKILQCCGEFSEAQHYLEVSIALYAGEDQGLALRYQSLGTLAFLKFDYQNAEKYFLQALRLFENYQDDLKCAEIYETLAYIVELQGRDNEALNWQERSVHKLATHGNLAVDAIKRLGDYHKKKKKYFEAIKCYWQAWELAENFGMDTEFIQKEVQETSLKLRKRK